MPDLGTLTALLGSVKTSIDLAKAIKNADVTLEKAETKLKFAELIEALAETKIQAAEIKILQPHRIKRILERCFTTTPET